MERDMARITIDGPAGAGKSTAARMLARRLGFSYVDTGAMYRAITLKVVELGAPLRSETLGKISAEADVRLKTTAEGTITFLDGRDVTPALRAAAVEALVSPVSRQPPVRRNLVRRQRRMASLGRVVLEGRDTGSVVLPGAEVKFFLTAEPEIRVRRRWQDYADRGAEISLEAVRSQVERRDRIDQERSEGPLVRPADSILVDSSRMDIDGMVSFMLGWVQKKTSRG